MTMKTPVRLAAAQIWSAKTRVARRLQRYPVRRNEHFLKYNIGAATYDEAYARAYGEEYLGYLEQWVRKAADRRVDLLLFPEFCFTPGVLAEPMKGVQRNPHAKSDAVRLYTWSGRLFMDWLCRQAKGAGMLLAGASYTVRSGRIYNTGLLADERGRLVLRYEKVHLPYDEKVNVAAGRDYPVARTRIGRIGFSICYDILFPEHQACLAACGAQIVLHPSGGYALPDESPGMGQNRLRIRASDHFCALVYASFAPESWEPGESCVIAPNGDVKAWIHGKKTGLAIGAVTVGGKRSWPSDPPDAPDREAVRRSLRRPRTYRPLLRTLA
jgi:predicted amidohydrolase